MNKPAGLCLKEADCSKLQLSERERGHKKQKTAQ
jgi:hypothetical protein